MAFLAGYVVGVMGAKWKVLPLLTGARRETLRNEKLPRANEVKGDTRERAHCAPGHRAMGSIHLGYEEVR